MAIGPAMAMAIATNAVQQGLFLTAVMLSLVGLYALQAAPFLAAVQVIVYTVAILMLFLFVLTLVGVDNPALAPGQLVRQPVALTVLAELRVLVLVDQFGLGQQAGDLR
jgi:NADH:ubiquinone oxidoreductase subunit 6 (subunit J)